MQSQETPEAQPKLVGLDPTLLQQLKRLQLSARRKVNSDTLGQYRSAFRGTGLSFKEAREYTPGDDIRLIHWKITARAQRPYVKSFEEERHLRVLLILDVSNSTFGQGSQRISEFAALVSMLAKSSGDALGLCLVSNKVEDYLKPKRSRNAVLQVLSKIMQLKIQKTNTSDLRPALDLILKTERKHTIVFIVSDFLVNDFSSELQRLAYRHEVVCVHTPHPILEQTPALGLVEFEDAESGQVLLVDSSQMQIRDSGLSQSAASLRQKCLAQGADFCSLSVSAIQTLSDLLKQRSKKFR